MKLLTLTLIILFSTYASAECPEGVDPTLFLCEDEPKEKAPPKKKELPKISFGDDENGLVFGDDKVKESKVEYPHKPSELWYGWYTGYMKGTSETFRRKRSVSWRLKQTYDHKGYVRWVAYTDAYYVDSNQTDGGTQFGLYCKPGDGKIYVWAHTDNESNRTGDNGKITINVEGQLYQYPMIKGSGKENVEEFQILPGRNAAVAELDPNDTFLSALAKGKRVLTSVLTEYEGESDPTPNGFLNLIKDYKYPLTGSNKKIGALMKKCPSAFSKSKELPAKPYASDWIRTDRRRSDGKTIHIAYAESDQGRNFGFYCISGSNKVQGFVSLDDSSSSFHKGVSWVDVEMMIKGDMFGSSANRGVAKKVLNRDSYVFPVDKNNFLFYRLMFSKDMRVASHYSKLRPEFFQRHLHDDYFSLSGSTRALKSLNGACRQGLFNNRNRMSGL